MAFFALAAEANLVASIAAGGAWFADLRTVAAAFPTLPILIHHQGMARAVDGPDSSTLREVLACANEPNIVVKASGFYYGSQGLGGVPLPGAAGDLPADRRRRSDRRRLAWGSDYPVSPWVACTFRQTLDVVRVHCAGHPVARGPRVGDGRHDGDPASDAPPGRRRQRLIRGSSRGSTRSTSVVAGRAPRSAEHDAAHHRQVPGQDRRHSIQPEARVAEDRLHQERARDDQPQRDAQARSPGDERQAHLVRPEHRRADSPSDVRVDAVVAPAPHRPSRRASRARTMPMPTSAMVRIGQDGVDQQVHRDRHRVAPRLGGRERPSAGGRSRSRWATIATRIMPMRNAGTRGHEHHRQ